jgi:hypothetical protein
LKSRDGPRRFRLAGIGRSVLNPILPGDAVAARTWLGAAGGPRFDRFVDLRKPGAARPAAAVKST